MQKKDFLEKIREKKETLIKDIIYYIVYNLRKSGHRYALEEELWLKYDIEFEEPTCNIHDYAIWGDYAHSLEKFVENSVDSKLCNYYLWKGYTIYPKIDFRDHQDDWHDGEYCPQKNKQNDWDNEKYCPPKKEINPIEENPFEPTCFLEENLKLNDDNYFISLLQSLETVISYQKELEKQNNQTSDKLLNENPYQCDWDEAEEDILESNIELILYGKNKKTNEYGLTDNDLDLFFDIRDFYEEISSNFPNIYSRCFNIFQDLVKTDEINKQKLLLTIKKLDESQDLEMSILELLEKDGIYFICSIPFLQNLEHRAFCIFSFNAIFDYNLVHKSKKEIIYEEDDEASYWEKEIIDEEDDEVLYCEKETKDFETLLNRGFQMTDFGIDAIFSDSFDNMIEMFGIDPNYQDENGNTILMNYFIKNIYEYKYKRHLLISLLKLNFDLYLTNNDGYNTLDIAYQYCHDEEVLNLVCNAYGTFIDETKIEFEKEMKLAREKIKTICMP